MVRFIAQADNVYTVSRHSQNAIVLKLVGKFRIINEKSKECLDYGLNEVVYGNFLELLARFKLVVLNKVINDALFKAEFDSNVLTKNDLAFKYILIYKYEINGGHEV